MGNASGEWDLTVREYSSPKPPTTKFPRGWDKMSMSEQLNHLSRLSLSEMYKILVADHPRSREDPQWAKLKVELATRIIGAQLKADEHLLRAAEDRALPRLLERLKEELEDRTNKRGNWKE